MAHFYAEIQGNKGIASRMGTKGSGIWCHIRGWDIGVNVQISHNEKTGKDEIYVFKTGGSNNPGTQAGPYFKVEEGE